MDLQNRTLYPVEDIAGVYCDAYLKDEHGLPLFVSLWSRDTAIQQLLAELTLAENGDSKIDVLVDGESRRLYFANIDNYRKRSAKCGSTVLGDLTHLVLYHRLIDAPDKANGLAVVLNPSYDITLLNDPDWDPCWVGDPSWDPCWIALRHTIHLPTLDHWREVLMEVALQHGWIAALVGLNIDGWKIDAPEDDVQEIFELLIRNRQLTLVAA